MADLSLLVDYSQVKKANKEIAQIGGSAKKSAAVFEAAFKKAEVQQKKSIDAVQKQIAFSKKMEAQKAKEPKRHVLSIPMGQCGDRPFKRTPTRPKRDSKGV